MYSIESQNKWVRRKSSIFGEHVKAKRKVNTALRLAEAQRQRGADADPRLLDELTSRPHIQGVFFTLYK